jgi:hypothetical protein
VGVRSSEHLEALRRHTREVEWPPPLKRINGFGVGLYGWMRDEDIPGAHWKLYFLTALWLPVLPLCAYLVQPCEGGFRFYRRVGLFNACRLYKSRVAEMYVSALLEGVGWLVVFGGMIVGVVLLINWLFGRL